MVSSTVRSFKLPPSVIPLIVLVVIEAPSIWADPETTPVPTRAVAPFVPANVEAVMWVNPVPLPVNWPLTKFISLPEINNDPVNVWVFILDEPKLVLPDNTNVSWAITWIAFTE